MNRTFRTVAVIGSLAMAGTILLGGCGGGSTAATASTPGGAASPASSAAPAPETMATPSSSAEVPLTGLTSAQPSSVPSSPASGSPEGLEPAGTGAKGVVAASGTVLFVDDSRTARLIGCRNLKSLGYQCAEASDGVEGLAKASQANFAAILTDWNMPNMDGIEMTKQFRARGDGTPIIILTSTAEKDKILEALQAGASEYLTKPFTIEALDLKLRTI